MSEPTIVSAVITAMPKSLLDPMPEIIATFSDRSQKTLFSFYPDEISFAPDEFLGLTEREACVMRHRKDVAYLRE